MPKHARDGYAYYQVDTPSMFREIELPFFSGDFTPEQQAEYEELKDLAEQHGTSVRSTSYQRG